MIRANIAGVKLKKTDLCEIVVIQIVLSQSFVSRPAFIPWKRGGHNKQLVSVWKYLSVLSNFLLKFKMNYSRL